MSQEPQANDEWTIHSLNIHGIFFQRWCKVVIAHSNGWKHLHSEYPVEFPPVSGTKRGDESAIWSSIGTHLLWEAPRNAEK
jgi:hypothetical protein